MIPFTFILLANLAISATSAQRGLKIAEVGKILQLNHY